MSGKTMDGDSATRVGFRVLELSAGRRPRAHYRGIDRLPDLDDEQLLCCLRGREHLVGDDWLSGSEEDALALKAATEECRPGVVVELVFAAVVGSAAHPPPGYVLAGFDCADTNLSLLSPRALEYMDEVPDLSGTNEFGLWPSRAEAEAFADVGRFAEHAPAVWAVWLREA